MANWDVIPEADHCRQAGPLRRTTSLAGPDAVRYRSTAYHHSLFSFLAGLLMMLRPLNTVVWAVSTGITVVAAALFVVTTILPTIYHQCAFRSTQAALIYSIVNMFSTQPPWPSLYIRDLMSDTSSILDANSLMWLLRYFSPWNPSSYSMLSVCARSLSPQLAADTICSLYLDSVPDKELVWTQAHAEAWQRRIDSSEFQLCCQILVDTVPETAWDGKDVMQFESLATRLRLLCLFLPVWVRSEYKNSEILKKAAKTFVELTTLDDNRLSQLPNEMRTEIRSEILKALLTLSRHKWPFATGLFPFCHAFWLLIICR
jgi:hypothetical protein